MRPWDLYLPFAIATILCWVGAGIIALKGKKKVATLTLSAGIIIFTTFIIILWLGLYRPPLRTMGETRLWYAFFLSIAGLVVYRRWQFAWIPLCTGVIASVFALINIVKPEIHSITLMPALQSPWFIPHVTVYILSYAMLGVTTIVSIMMLFKSRLKEPDSALYDLMDNSMYIGFGFLMFGLISGAVWAKAAWGHYWAWDPKETWAFITATAYLIAIHMRLQNRYNRAVLWLLPFAFILLMVAWVGVNYLPSAQTSVHVYS